MSDDPRIEAVMTAQWEGRIERVQEGNRGVTRKMVADILAAADTVSPLVGEGAAGAQGPAGGGVPFRMARLAGGGVTPSTERAYRVESVEPMTEREALQALRDLGSPYQGRKYEDAPPVASAPAPEPSGKRMRAAVVLFLECENGLDPASLAQPALFQSGLLKDGLTVRLRGEEHHVSIAGVMEVGMALGNGYLWASVTPKGYTS